MLDNILFLDKGQFDPHPHKFADRLVQLSNPQIFLLLVIRLNLLMVLGDAYTRFSFNKDIAI